MPAEAVRAAALELIAAGVNDCEIARRLGIPRTTVRDWRRPRYVAEPREVCWRCWGHMLPMRFEVVDYAELLGLYLGDGHNSVRIYRRASVALMLEHVGTKN